MPLIVFPGLHLHLPPSPPVFCVVNTYPPFSFTLLVLDVVLHFILGLSFVDELLIVVSYPLLVELVEILILIDS